MSTIITEGGLVKKLIDLKLEDSKSDDPKVPHLANIVTMDEVSKDDLKDIYDAGIKVHHFDEVCKAGEANTSFKEDPCEPDDNLMFSYTSGTTGDPKGVKTSQIALLSMIASLD